MDGLLYILIFGAVAGWIAGLIMKGRGFGLIGNIIIGIVGAFIGGWLFDVLKISIASGVAGSLIKAVAGAVVLLFVANLIKK